MRLSEFNDYEIIDISTGARQGGYGDGDLLFDASNGKIKALQIPESRSRAGFFTYSEPLQIPWASIRKIGRDLILVESGQTIY